MSVGGTASSLATGAIATGGLATIEAATGISVPMFVWGIVGGLWAFWYLAPMSVARRLLSLGVAALVAGVAAKPVSLILISAATYFLKWWPAAVDGALIGALVAILIGLLCHTVIGRKLIEVANRGADGVLK